MPGILIEQLGTVMILKVHGELTFDKAVEALNGFYSLTSCHALWDLRTCSSFEITIAQYKELLTIANDLMKDRISGRTAFVSADDNIFAILTKLKDLQETSEMPYEYSIFMDYEEALNWLSE